MPNNINLQVNARKCDSYATFRQISQFQAVGKSNKIAAWYSKQLQPLPEIKRNIVAFVEQLTLTERIIFDDFIYGDCHYEILYPTQAYIGSRADISERHARRLLKKLESYGCIASYIRFNTSKLYRVSHFFRNIAVRKLLAHLLKSCRFAPFLLQAVNGQGISNTPSNTFQSANVLLKKNIDLFTNPSLTNIHSKSTYNRENVGKLTRAGPVGYQKYTQMEKKGAMAQDRTTVSMAVRDISEVSLTKWGQITLSAFPDAAIHYARENIRAHKGVIHNRFALFKYLCNAYCQQKDIAPNWQQMRELAIAHGMPEDAQMMLDNAPIPGSAPTPKPITPNIKPPTQYKPAKSWDIVPTAADSIRGAELILIMLKEEQHKELQTKYPTIESRTDLTACERALLELIDKQFKSGLNI